MKKLNIVIGDIVRLNKVFYIVCGVYNLVDDVDIKTYGENIFRVKKLNTNEISFVYENQIGSTYIMKIKGE